MDERQSEQYFQDHQSPADTPQPFIDSFDLNKSRILAMVGHAGTIFGKFPQPGSPAEVFLSDFNLNPTNSAQTVQKYLQYVRSTSGQLWLEINSNQSEPLILARAYPSLIPPTPFFSRFN